MPAFSDYILYFDESGSPELTHVDPDYPLFVLAAVLVSKEDYLSRIVPAVQRLKFDFVGHDQIILHEIDIRKQDGDFLFLRRDQAVRLEFLSRVGLLVEEAPVEAIVAVIRKDSLKRQYVRPYDPYNIALQFCLEMAAQRLYWLGQEGREVAAVFERRGSREDAALELAFRRIVDGKTGLKIGAKNVAKVDALKRFLWTPRFVSKKSNSSGLQLADLLARRVGLSILRPDQPNRAFDTIRPKIAEGMLKCFP
ncbi:DUF3800 domain-containing protein [Tabrizicola sp.]|uniref:DUF3800 domain-containing protein n=1 Tax=Tabrizicola sp. TaxID=2005166 RepID=UPI003F2F69F7